MKRILEAIFRRLRRLAQLAAAAGAVASFTAPVASAQPVATVSSLSTVLKVTSGNSLSASLALPAGLTLTLGGTVTGSANVIPLSLVSLSSALTGWNATTSASFPTFTQLSGSLSAYQPLAANLTGWAATSSASYLTAANVSASLSSYVPLAGGVTVAGTTTFATASVSTLTASAFNLASGTVSGTTSLTGQFDGTNGLRIASSGSASNVLIFKTISQSAARTLSISIDANATLTFTSGLLDVASLTGRIGGANLTTSIPVGNLAAGSGATSSTFWRGDGTWASPAGGSGYSTASASSGLFAYSVSATTVSYGAAIFQGITGSASPALNSGSLSIAPGSTFSVSSSPTVSGSGLINIGANTLTLGGNLTSTGVNTFSTLSASTQLFGASVSVSGAITATGSITTAATVAGFTGVFGAGGATIGTNGANGGGGLTVTYGSNYGPQALWTTNSYTFTILAGTSGEARTAGDGTALANKISFIVGGGNTVSAQIASASGIITVIKGLTVSLTTDATSSTSAAVTLSGGLGVQKAVQIGGAVTGGSFTTSGAVTAGSFTTSGTATVGGVTTSGTINGGTITGTSFTTSGAVTAGSLTASGNMFAAGGQFSSDVNYLGSSYTYSAIPTIGIAIGAAFDNNNRLVEANQSDFLNFLGLSSRLAKNSIEPFHGGLDVVRKIDVTRYHYNANANTGYSPDEWLYGPIAEDLNAVFPDAVSRTADPAKWSVRDRVLLALNTNAIKELDARTTGLATSNFAFSAVCFVGAIGFGFFLWAHRRHRREIKRLHAHLGLPN